MRPIIRIFLFAFAVTMISGLYGVTFNTAGSSAMAQSSGQSCPRTAVGQRGTNRSYSCRCTSAQTSGGTVWGTDIYTDDSSICRAAVHAGVIAQSGGIIRYQIVSGRASYRASTRRGVSSRSYGSWTGSFRFGRAGASAGGNSGNRLASTARCSGSWAATGLKVGKSKSCRCDAYGSGNNPRNRSGYANRVLGSGPYRSYASNVCNAAIHAGVIGDSGGRVTFTALRYDLPFFASRNNGIRTDFNATPGHAFRFSGQRNFPGFCPGSVAQISKTGIFGSRNISCQCSARMVSGRSGPGVYGNGRPYSSFSNPCRAALHAGIVSNRGGLIDFRIFQNRRYFNRLPYRFTPTTRNGVKSKAISITRNSRNFGHSFIFRNARSSGVGGNDFNTIAGTWSTNIGTWTPRATKHINYFQGDYQKTPRKFLHGKYTGNTRTFRGHWYHTKTSRKCKTKRYGYAYWGDVHFNFNEKLNRFTGSYGYCGANPTHNWSGSRSR